MLCKEYNRPYLASHAAFLENVASSFYGDDGMSTVSLKTQDMYTPKNYVEHAAAFGVKCTPADKTKGDPKFRALHKMEFLKRNFVKAVLPNGTQSHYWCGKLQLDSFHKMLSLVMTNKPHDYWKEPDTIRFDKCTIVGTVEMALIEATNHGPVFWRKMKTYLMERCRLYNIAGVSYGTYISCFNLLWGTDLPEGFQSAYSEELDNFTHQSMSQPAVVGDGATTMHTTGSGAPSATPMAGVEEKTQKLSGFLQSGTGSVGMLPSDLYHHDIAVGNIAWSSTQNAGTIIYKQPISPKGANAYVQYFTAPYNAWTGGLIWSFVIAGTGFNGGKLACCRMPPNYNPGESHTLTDLTVFPYETIDVKEATTISKIGVDEKNVLFHWRNEAQTSINATGGTFVVFVLAPLISSTGAPASVNLVIFNRPDMSFRVAQLMPLPTIGEASPSIASFHEFFPPTQSSVLSPYTGERITEMVTYSSATTVLIQGMYGQVQGDGTPYARKYQQWTQGPLAVYNNLATPAAPQGGDLYNWTDTNVSDVVSRPLQLQIDTQGNQNLTVSNFNAQNWTSTPVNSTNVTAANLVLTTNLYNTTLTAYGAQTNPTMLHGFNQCQMSVVPDTDGKTITPVLNESLVMFRTQHGAVNLNLGNLDSTQTTPIIASLTAGLARGALLPGQAVLFTVVDIETDLPIGYIKFNYPGYFTTTLSATTVVAQYSANLFVPTSLIDMTTQIPSSSVMIQNSILVSAKRNRYSRTAMVDDVTERVMQRMNQLAYRDSSAERMRMTKETLPPLSGRSSNRE